MPSVKPIELDGATLEGGGQLVRVALSLSAITGIPIHIYNIRANRAASGRSQHRAGNNGPKSNFSNIRKDTRRSKVEGGLKNSHLAAVLYLAQCCNAELEGAEVYSRELTFIPHSYNTAKRPHGLGLSKDLHIDLKTNTIDLQSAGSVWLVLQALLPYLMFSQSPISQQTHSSEDTQNESPKTYTVTIKGGTNVSKSMSGEYVQHVLIPTMTKIGGPRMEVEIVRRGWATSPPCIGEIRVTLHKTSQKFTLPPFQVVDRGTISKITLVVVAGDAFSQNLAIEETRKVIAEHFDNDILVDILPAEDSGDVRRLYILLVAETSNGWRLGRDFLGSGRAPKNEAEHRKIIQNASQTIVRDLNREVRRGGCVDEFMQDQLVIFQALASGTSRVDGGEWTGNENPVAESCGDDGGSLHTRTVRWVCEKILRRRDVQFRREGICSIGDETKLPSHGVEQDLEQLSI